MIRMTRESEASLEMQGFVRVPGLTADAISRRLGVPCRQRVWHDGAPGPTYVPRWVVELLECWPRTDSVFPLPLADTVGFVMVEKVVRYVLRTGREDVAAAACALARLEGDHAVDQFLEALE